MQLLHLAESFVKILIKIRLVILISYLFDSYLLFYFIFFMNQ